MASTIVPHGVDDGVEAQTGADGGGTNGAEGSGVVAEAVDGVQRRRSGASEDAHAA